MSNKPQLKSINGSCCRVRISNNLDDLYLNISHYSIKIIDLAGNLLVSLEVDYKNISNNLIFQPSISNFALELSKLQKFAHLNIDDECIVIPFLTLTDLTPNNYFRSFEVKWRDQNIPPPNLQLLQDELKTQAQRLQKMDSFI